MLNFILVCQCCIKHTKAVEISAGSNSVQGIKLMLFDSIKRTDLDYKAEAENLFCYLNRSARPEMAAVRNLLCQLVENYPLDEQSQIISRLRSGNHIEFKSTTFELIIYKILKTLKFEIITHPNLPNGSSKKPDFLVKTPTGDEFYVEAVLASHENGDDIGLKKQKMKLIESLNELTNTNFFISISEEGKFEKLPSSKILKKKISDWLNSLDYDQVVYKTNSTTNYPVLEWKHEDWHVVFEAIPKIINDKNHRIIASVFPEGSIIDASSAIKSAIKNKSNRYGQNLDKPLIIAVNVDLMICDNIDEMDALFGKETTSYNILDRTILHHRMSDGVWGTNKNPKYTRNGAAWIFNDISILNIPSRQHKLYINPWSQFTLPLDLYQLPHFEVVDSELKYSTGLSLPDIFALEINWLNL